MEIRYFTATDGANLAYADQGEGTAILCLAGLTRNMHDFAYVMPHLAGHRVIRMDYRGRGQSQWTGAGTYNVPQEALDAVALLDHLGIDKAAILGTSRGGLVGMVMGATVRDRVLGLCLNDVGPALERKGLEHIIDYIGRQPTARTIEEMAFALERHSVGFRGVPHSRWLEEARHQYRPGMNGVALSYDPELRVGFLEAMKDPTATAWPLFDALAGLPVCLIRGDGSNLMSSKIAAEMQARRPDMITAVVPGRGHIPYLDEPEAVTALHAWLAAVAQSVSRPS